MAPGTHSGKLYLVFPFYTEISLYILCVGYIHKQVFESMLCTTNLFQSSFYAKVINVSISYCYVCLVHFFSFIVLTKHIICGSGAIEVWRGGESP